MQKNNDNQIYYEVSQSQKATFIGHLYAKKIMPFNITFPVNVGTINFEALQKAFDSLIQRHDILRTTLLLVDGKVKQVVWSHKSSQVKIDVINLMNTNDKEKKIEKIGRDLNHAIFKLDQHPWLTLTLIKLEKNKNILYFNIPHMIADMQSIEVIKNELSKLYKSHLNGESIKTPNIFHYKDYIAEVNEILSSDKREKHRLYWMNLLKETPKIKLTSFFSYSKSNRSKSYKETILQEINECCGTISPKMESDFLGTVSFLKFEQGHSFNFIIDSERLLSLKKIVKETRTNLSVVLIATFYLLIYKLTGEKNIIIGINSNLRDREKLNDVIGFFINTVLIRYQIDEPVDINNLISGVYMSFIKSLRHKIYPFERALFDSDIPLHCVGNLFLNITSNETSLSIKNNQDTNHSDNIVYPYFDIDCHISLFNNIVEIQCNYKIDLFTKQTIEFIFNQYLEMIDDFKINATQKNQNPKLTLYDKSKND